MHTSEIIHEFHTIFQTIKDSGHPEPNAMNLATADKSGRPSSRIVLLKSVDKKGFVFFTNYNSRKARELDENPFASLCFIWLEYGRQIRIEGRVEKVSTEESDAYFASRPRQSQIGAWASRQSQQIEHKLDFEKRIAKYTLKFGISTIPRPDFWGGFRLIPDHIEFWQKKDFRLHERRLFTRLDDEEWQLKRLYP
ncbi:MAG: pyridoxamine 5'-phosphate oxidase [Lentisphaeraceae bacterium]|nr:pyridoxamine 5'-phosphate oxidase [Lentisphaeraceae bacterium]